MMAILLRIALMTLGAGAIEIGIVPALVSGSLVDLALVLLVGLPLLIAGSIGFVRPLFKGHDEVKGSRGA